MAVITISRQFGAGGKTLGVMLAERLGYVYADEEIIQLIAKKAKVSPHWVKSIEREAGGNLLKYISGMRIFRKSFLAGALDRNRGYIDDEIYVDLLHEVITQLAWEGNVVIIGRGGQFILQKLENVLHVFLGADYDYRVNFMVENYNLTHKQAVQVVRKMNDRRLNLYKKFGREDFEDPSLYHLAFNMRQVSMERAVDIIVSMVESRKNKAGATV